MRKVLSLLAGIGIGAALGIGLVMLLSPVSGAQLQANLRRMLSAAAAEAHRAQTAKRAELEARLTALQREQASA